MDKEGGLICSYVFDGKGGGRKPSAAAPCWAAHLANVLFCFSLSLEHLYP